MKRAQILIAIGALLITPTSSIAETKILCSADTGTFIAEGQAHPAQETFSLTFNQTEILSSNRRCDTVLVNMVSDDEIYLACEFDINCVKDGKPVTTTVRINRLTGKYDSYNSCLGYMTWGTCQKAVAKF